MIKDKNYSIISCSPENLITKKGSKVSTKPIAGTVKKTKYLNKNKALNFFRNNIMLFGSYCIIHNNYYLISLF